MPGDGTKMVTTTTRDFPAILDVTRLISRVGFKTSTGVDRVELAYLTWCISTRQSIYGFARLASGYAILDRAGLVQIYKRLVGTKTWGTRDARALVGFKTAIPRGRAESDVRRFAVDRCGKDGVLALIQRASLGDHIYLNIGHSNISDEVFGAFTACNHSTAAFLHDVIPLEYPEFQGEGSVSKFQTKIATIERFADVILVNSEDTKARVKAHLQSPKTYVVSHLGIEQQKSKMRVSGINRPYFIVVGTIEPRKNHALLLDVWDQFKAELEPQDVPNLHIVGQRGWKNTDLFARLDKLPKDDPITEHNEMSDDDLWSLLSHATALLFPSITEGFGLPSLEAAAIGTPVICGDLAIHHELLADYPVYLNPQDTYLWKKTILEQTQATEKLQRPKPHIPSWDEHFARVNRAITHQG